MWIARNKNGGLYVFSSQPKRQEQTFAFGGNLMQLPSEHYPEVTWVNSPLELLIKQAVTLNNRPYVAINNGTINIK